jgi:hypothetical protein
MQSHAGWTYGCRFGTKSGSVLATTCGVVAYHWLLVLLDLYPLRMGHLHPDTHGFQHTEVRFMHVLRTCAYIRSEGQSKGKVDGSSGSVG